MQVSLWFLSTLGGGITSLYILRQKEKDTGASSRSPVPNNPPSLHSSHTTTPPIPQHPPSPDFYPLPPGGSKPPGKHSWGPRKAERGEVPSCLAKKASGKRLEQLARNVRFGLSQATARDDGGGEEGCAVLPEPAGAPRIHMIGRGHPE